MRRNTESASCVGCMCTTHVVKCVITAGAITRNATLQPVWENKAV